MNYTVESFSGESANPNDAIAIASRPAVKWLNENQRVYTDGHEVFKSDIHMFYTVDHTYMCVITVIGAYRKTIMEEIHEMQEGTDH